MADTFARMRQLIGTTAEWAANDRVIGLGEFAIERLGGGGVRLKLGDGVATFSTLPYSDPGIFDFVLKDGDTMTGPLVLPELTVQGPATVQNGLTVSAGTSSFGGPVNLGANATATSPASLADDSTKVPTTHWVQQQVGGIISGLTIKGTWNAATNTPALASGGAGVPTPERGDFYIVSVSGTTMLDGINVWNAGDSVVFNGIAWQRVPQTLTNAQIIAGLGYTPVNKAGDTMTGALTVISNAIVRGAAGAYRSFQLQTDTLARWSIAENDAAESGSNAGSNFSLISHNDAGGFLATPITVNRASGIVTFTPTPVVGTMAAGDNSTRAASTAFVTARGGGIVREVTLASPAATIDLFTLGVKSAQIMFRLPVTNDGVFITIRQALGSTPNTTAAYSSQLITAAGATVSGVNSGTITTGTLSTTQSNIAGTALSGSLMFPDIASVHGTGTVVGNLGGGGAQWAGTVGLYMPTGGNGFQFLVSAGNFAAGAFARVIGWP